MSLRSILCECRVVVFTPIFADEGVKFASPIERRSARQHRMQLADLCPNTPHATPHADFALDQMRFGSSPESPPALREPTFRQGRSSPFLPPLSERPEYRRRQDIRVLHLHGVPTGLGYMLKEPCQGPC